MQAVRERAGVSNGTLFHHFPKRVGLASAMVAAGLADHQRMLLTVLRPAKDARAGVFAVVKRHLKWLTENPELARLFLTEPPDTLRQTVDADTLDANRAFFAEVASWLQTHGWTGNPDLLIVLALWTGPTHDYYRRWPTNGSRSATTAHRDALAQGAWDALAPLLTKE
jgi:AcrR family transcriptional regulator